MESMEELAQLSQSMLEAAALLADDDIDDSNLRRTSTFLNVVALGNTGAGKSSVLNSLIGHPVLPTGENGATRAPISIDLLRDGSMSSKALGLQIDKKVQQISASALRHSLQERLSKGSMKISRKDEISMKLRTSTAPPLKLIDLPGLDQKGVDESLASDYGAHNDAILLVVVPASRASEISSSRALRLAKEYDADGTRTIGVISKTDKAAGEQKVLAAVHALILNQGPRIAADIPWVAMIGQSVTIASAQAGSTGGSPLEAAWRAEAENLRSILSGIPRSKLGRVALMDNLAKQIRKRMKVRIPCLLSGLQGKSQMVGDELARLGEQMVQSIEGTRAIALELCRQFEDQFLEHIAAGKVGGWKVVATFEGKFPNRFKQIPLDRHFDIDNVKRIVLEADGYQPYLISPEKGLRSLIRSVLEEAKEPCRLCVDEVHSVLLDIVNAASNATPGLARYPPFKREVITIALSALENFRIESKKMVVALVDMERAFLPPQHFIRLVQRRIEKQRREDELNNRSSKKATSPQTGSQQADDTLKSKENSTLKVAGSSGEITVGYLLKKSAKTNGWKKRWFLLNEKVGKLAYTKKEEEKQFRGIIVLEDCSIEVDEEETPESLNGPKKANGPDFGDESNLVFRITSRSAYKTVLKGHSAVLLKAENLADKVEWVNKISKLTPGSALSSRGPESSTWQSYSDGSLETITRRPVYPEEELRWISQEVRSYVEAVLNSLAANVPKAIVLCQVEKAKEDMLNLLYGAVSSLSNSKIEELLQEDRNVRWRREKFQRQSSILAKLTCQLSIHDSGEAMSDSAESGDDWRSAFGGMANGTTINGTNSTSKSRSTNGYSQRYESPQNGDMYGSNSSGRRTPNRLPPAPPHGNNVSSMYRY